MKVALTDGAREDLADIYAYYAQRNPSSADRVVGTILAAINGLAQFPLIGRHGPVPRPRPQNPKRAATLLASDHRNAPPMSPPE